jgi:hypothetical protein
MIQLRRNRTAVRTLLLASTAITAASGCTGPDADDLDARRVAAIDIALDTGIGFESTSTSTGDEWSTGWPDVGVASTAPWDTSTTFDGASTTWTDEDPSTGGLSGGMGSGGTDTEGYGSGSYGSGSYGSGGSDAGDTDGGGGDTDGGGTGGSGGSGDGGVGDEGGGDDGGGAACPNHWVRAPRATSTAHIEPFNPLTAANALLAQDPWKTASEVPLVGGDYANALRAIIAGLALSANTTPPASFNNGAYGNRWGIWKNSQEYRGFLDIFPFRVYCTSATGTLAVKPGAAAGTTADYSEDVSMQMSYGYTKLPTHFQAAERHGTTPIVNKMTFGDRTGARTNQCLTHTGYYASRVGQPERVAGIAVLLYDAPFIWQRVESTACCDGTYEVNLRASHFPTQSLYLNFDRTMIRWQTRLAQFLISGGTTLNPVGVGNLAAAGTPTARNGSAKVTDACTGAVTQQYTPNPSIAVHQLP